uniref:Long-chain-fatty-acid--luciferin-component ligase n=1 Tax=uncultured Armatimonadetes bacterium TaxID=157466 RepID=A0A6J4IX34_9BACT|nr:Long-chain-fatty-acid--luciferin-component ligase [uncultured Armatimonadetes bacterium]
MTATAEPLVGGIAAFLARADDGPAHFDRLARQVFSYQYARNAPYRAFCLGRGATPDGIESWRDIPAAPAAAFKRFALSCAPESACRPERGGRVFHSSGTTGQETSRHFLNAPALDLYRASLRSGYRRFVLPDGQELPVLALMPPPEEAPHSSLSFMLGELVADYGGRFFWREGWQGDLVHTLRSLRAPAVVFGTAFAWVHFLDGLDGNITLPPGSRIVETGGFKGRSREVSRDDLYTLFTRRLGVSATHCVSEYGMSEMASQFYDTTLRDHLLGNGRIPRKVGPPWLRTRLFDPVSGRDAAPGQPGLLVHYDLANLNSVLALQTEDYGHACDDGEGFVLLGRAPGAVLRGCSLTAEEMEQGRQTVE